MFNGCWEFLTVTPCKARKLIESLQAAHFAVSFCNKSMGEEEGLTKVTSTVGDWKTLKFRSHVIRCMINSAIVVQKSKRAQPGRHG